MRYSLLLAIIWIISLKTNAQSGLSLTADPSLLQSDLYNPAMFVRKGTHLGLVSLHADLYHSSLGYRDFTVRQNGRRILSISSLLEGIEDDNEFSTNGSWDILSVRFIGDNWKVGFDHGIRMNSFIDYPRELIDLAVRGNEPFLGQTVSFGPGFEYGLYHATGVVLTYFKENWSGGIRVKWLNGLKYIHSERTFASVYTDTLFYATTIFTDFLVQNANVIQDREDQLLPYGVDTYSSYPLFSGNNGLALDAGFAGNYKQRLYYAVGVSDLGFIRWRKNAKTLSSNEQLFYEGEQINDVLQISQISIQGAVDTLANVLHLDEREASFTSSLRGYFRGTLRYTKSEEGSFAIQAIYSEMLRHSWVFGVHIDRPIGERWKIGINMSNHYEKFNLGFQLCYSTPRIDMYLFCDNVTKGLDPYRSSRTHFRIGTNLHWER